MLATHLLCDCRHITAYPFESCLCPRTGTELGKEPWWAQVLLVRDRTLQHLSCWATKHRGRGFILQATQSKCNFSPMAKTASVKSYDNWEMAHAARKWRGPQTPLEPREVWNISGDFWGVWGDLLLIAKDRVLFASFFLFSFLKRKIFVKSRAVEIKQWRQSYEQEGLQLLFWQWSWCINS